MAFSRPGTTSLHSSAPRRTPQSDRWSVSSADPPAARSNVCALDDDTFGIAEVPVDDHEHFDPTLDIAVPYRIDRGPSYRPRTARLWTGDSGGIARGDSWVTRLFES